MSVSRAARQPLAAAMPGQPARATPRVASLLPRICRGKLSVNDAPNVADAVNSADRDQSTSLGWWWATVVSRARHTQAVIKTGVSFWNLSSAWLVVRIWLPKPLGRPSHLRKPVFPAKTSGSWVTT